MSKPEILGAVKIGRTTYKAGDEDAFAAAASPEQITRLTEKKAISGFGKAEKPAETPVEETPAEDAPIEESETAEDKPKGRGKK